MSNRLDISLLQKLVIKTHKEEKYLREQISKKGSQWGISSEAVLIILAKKVGLGTSRYQRTLAPNIQEEVRNFIVADRVKGQRFIIKEIIKKNVGKSNSPGVLERMTTEIISKVLTGILKPSN